MYCADCEKELNINETSEKDWATTFILSTFMGLFGIHRFYTGYTGIGIAQALTLGGLGIWSLIDWVSICINSYRDFENKKLKDYVKTLGYGAIGSIFLFFILILSFILIMVFLTYKLQG